MNRTASVTRETKETQIAAALDLDGGPVSVRTGIGFFDHMLQALAFYAGFGLTLTAKGDLEVDGHHTAEDTGIVLGQALRQALGDKAGIVRFSSALVSGRPYLVLDAPMPQALIGGYDSCLTEEFMRALCVHGGLTIHQAALYGKNAHHITEALFKSLGLALKEAVRVEGGGVTSTKGVL